MFINELKRFPNREILEEEDNQEDDLDGDDDQVMLPKTEYERLLQESQDKDRKIAKLAAQRNKAREERNQNTVAPFDEAAVERVVENRQRLKELQVEYPDVNYDEVKKVSKERNLSIDEAFKIVGFDEVKRQPPQMSLGGKPDTGGSKEYTMDDLKPMKPHEFNAVMDLVDAGKARIVKK